MIDDPFKNFEEAYSEGTRESIWNWYTTTARSRLAPGGGVLVIMQRWHFDDMAGRMIERGLAGTGEKFEVITYPALAEEDEQHRKKDEPLHPERYDLEAMLAMKMAMNPRDWAALYQQNPVPVEGGYFREQMLKRYGSPPARRKMNVYAAFDLAIGKKETNDYTVGVVAGVDEDDNLFILDLVRGRWDSHEIVNQILGVHKRWQPTTIAIEKGHLSMAIDPFLQRRISEERIYDIHIKDMPVGRRDKEARARAIQGRMAQGRVLFPASSHWMDDLVLEMLQFPAGKHDDQVDALAWIGLLLEEITPKGGAQPVDRSNQGWRKRLKKYVQPAYRKRGGHMGA